MAYTALYRKWRPQIFEDIIGQNHVTQTISNQIKSEKLSHAYLFCGTRGTGKTSTAKIFSKAINCLNLQNGNPCNECEICTGINNGSIMDIIEIDAASNNGVDNIREIREEVVYTPSRSKYKVYIIDEVHMLSTGAFNALLKTLEEPPRHVIFILATTEPHKIPATILSRCQRYDFKRITDKDIFLRIRHILENENIIMEEKPLKIISKIAYGSMRDALSILDQCIAFGGNNITYDMIKDTLGITDTSIYYNIIKYILQKDIKEVMNYIEQLYINGKDINIFIEDIMKIYRDILVCKATSNSKNLFDMEEEEYEILRELSNKVSEERVISSIEILSDAQQNIKWLDNSRIILEITMIKLCNNKYHETKEELISRIAEIEKRIQAGSLYDKKEIINSKEELAKSKENTIIEEKKKEKKETPTQKIITKWSEILKEIKNKNELQLYGNLTKAKIIETNESIDIVFDDSLSIIKMLVEKKADIIKEAIKETIFVEVKIKCFLEKEYNHKEEVNNNEFKKEDKINIFEKKKEKWPDTINIYDK